MTAEEVRAAQENGAAVLDLRTPGRFAPEHLEGAINLQFNRADLVDRAEMVLPMDLPLIIHGEPEAIAKMAAKLLEDGGFKVLGHLEGGLKGWKEAGLPTVTLDTISPILVVRIPGSEAKDGVTTYRTEKGPAAVMRVTGYTDDAVQVFVNGELVAISDEGYFEYEMALAVKTSNPVEVTAKDAAGNEVDWSVTVSHKYTPPEADEGFELGWLILIIGLIILVICIAIGYRMVTYEQPEVEMPEVYEEEVLAPAELPEVEEEELEDEDEGVEIEVEEEEDLEEELEDEDEEVHEITAPSERPRTSASRRETSAVEATMPEMEDKDLEDRDADADIGADETDQEGI